MKGYGYIKLHKRFLDWGWFKDHKTSVVFIYLLLNANYEKKKSNNIVLDCGQVIISQATIQRICNLTRQEVRTSLKKLESTGEIRISATNKYSLVTIVKWGEYQMTQKLATNKQPTNQPTNNQQNNQHNNQVTNQVKNPPEVLKNIEGEGLMTHYTNQQNNQVTNQQIFQKSTSKSTILKEDIRIKKELDKSNSILVKKSFDLFWALYPRKVKKKDAFKKFEKILSKKEATIEQVIDGLKAYVAHKPDYQDWAHPVVWLNGARWEDDHGQPKQSKDPINLEQQKTRIILDLLWQFEAQQSYPAERKLRAMLAIPDNQPIESSKIRAKYQYKKPYNQIQTEMPLLKESERNL